MVSGQIEKTSRSWIPLEKVIYEDAKWMVDNFGLLKKAAGQETVITFIKMIKDESRK